MDTADVTVIGGTLSNVIHFSRTTFMWIHVDSGDLGLKVTVREDAVTQGNPETSTQWGDVGIPVTLTASQTLTQPGETVTVTATFDEDVTGITAGDFSATDADNTAVTLENFQTDADDASVYTIDAVMPASGSGTVTVTLAAGAASEGNTAETVDIAYSPVTVVLTDDDADDIIDYGGTVKITATFDRDVTGIAAGDFSASVGTVSGFKKVSDKIYEITWTAPASGTGTATITLAEDAATQGNPETTLSLTYPTPPATVTLAAVPASVSNGAASTLTATFNKDVTGLAADDFSADKGTVSAFTKISNKVYRVTWTAPASGTDTATITLRANAATERNAEATVDIAYAPEPPATVVLTAAPASVNSGGTVLVTATFNKDVGGIAANDFSADVGTLSGFTKSSDKVYRVTWTAPSAGTGTATITLRANAATVGNAEATVEIQYAPIPPAMVVLAAGETFVSNRQTTRVTATFSKNVTGVALNDFSSDAGRVSAFTRVSATVYHVTWTAPATRTGTATITLRANAATERNAKATVEIQYAPLPDASLTAGPEFSDTYDETLGYNVLPESLGALKIVYPNGAVVPLGNIWYTDSPYNIAQTRMLPIGDGLQMCAGYGTGDSVLRYNSQSSQADNMAHITYGKTLHYVIPKFSPSSSVYAALADLAKRINATLSFEKNVIMITDRRPYRAVADGKTGTGTGTIGFRGTNKTFPRSGHLFIGKEILRYTGIAGSAFTGITRGVLGSPIADHADASRILYLDTLIQTEQLGTPYRSITISSDTNRIFNVIRDSAGIAEVRDEESINLYGERPFRLELSLTRHEKVWIEEIFRSYLEELKDLQSIVNIQVRPDFSLRLGQITAFIYKNIIRPMQIVSIRYEQGATHLKGRTLRV